VWFQAAALSRTQGDRALARLEQHDPALIKRAHGAWAGKPHVLFVRPTETARSVWDAATTFEALDELLKGDESGPLHQLWQAWPGIDAKKAGGIAEWYELLDNRKLTKENLKPHAQYLLQRILKSDPTIVDIGDTDLLWQRLCEVSQSLAVEDAA
jgi:hypothetical protein